jgi:hypothetical protein
MHACCHFVAKVRCCRVCGQCSERLTAVVTHPLHARPPFLSSEWHFCCKFAAVVCQRSLRLPTSRARPCPPGSMRAAAVLMMAAMAAGQSGEDPTPEAKSSGGSYTGATPPPPTSGCKAKSGCSGHTGVSYTGVSSGCDLCCFGKPTSITFRYDRFAVSNNQQPSDKWGVTPSGELTTPRRRHSLACCSTRVHRRLISHIVPIHPNP